MFAGGELPGERGGGGDLDDRVQAEADQRGRRCDGVGGQGDDGLDDVVGDGRGCTEPSNVAAGGQVCPVRFRCVGCSHFRTDVSYLPDLEAYLADLLRNRERLAAFTDADDWAKGEAMPSSDEISRVRRLVQRVRAGLTAEDRAQIQQAVTTVRRTRAGTVPFGMPKVRQPLSDRRPGRTAWPPA